MSRSFLPVLAPSADSVDAAGETFDLIITPSGEAFGLFLPEAFADALDSRDAQAPPTSNIATFWGVNYRPRALNVDLAELRAWVHREMGACTICEYRCGTDRTGTALDRRTVCMVGTESVVQRVVTLAGEEPEISPAGSVFYSGCNMRCTHCHSWEFSHVIAGSATTADLLAARALADSPRTLQFVGGNPDHHLLSAIDVIAAARASAGEAMPPVVWNTNFYMTPPTIARLATVVDVWVVDVKWWADSCARRAGKVPSTIDSQGQDRRYRTVMERNLALLPSDARVLVRHVPVPGHERCCTDPIREWAASAQIFSTPTARYHEPPYLNVGRD